MTDDNILSGDDDDVSTSYAINTLCYPLSNIYIYILYIIHTYHIYIYI